MNRSISLALILAILFALGGCAPSPAQKKHEMLSARQKAFKWNMKTLAEAYRQAGHTDLNWDDAATAALTEFAKERTRTVPDGEDGNWQISNNCATAVAAGCDDPMIRYLYVRYCMDTSQSRQAFADAFIQAAQGLENSPYPEIRKYYGWLRAGQQVHFAYGYGTNIPSRVKNLDMWNQIAAHLFAALGDKTMPAQEVCDAAEEFLDLWQFSPPDFKRAYDTIKSEVNDDRRKEPPWYMLEAHAEMDLAWEARGGGYADTVTPEGWKQFGLHMTNADQLLTKAWNIDPYDPQIALQMLRVELAEGSRTNMELWFNRAMTADPNNYEACNSKLLFLEPKWYGSIDAMLQFGRECATNDHWGGRVPLILVKAHQEIVTQYAPEALKATYWSLPQVWADVKLAFDGFFLQNPDATAYYQNYAWFAAQAGQWPAFNDAIAHVKNINYGLFGGEEAFDKLVARAKKTRIAAK